MYGSRKSLVSIGSVHSVAAGVVLPASVTAIEYGAFMGCDNLRYVLVMGNKITTLGDNLFGESQGKIIYKEKQ